MEPQDDSVLGQGGLNPAAQVSVGDRFRWERPHGDGGSGKDAATNPDSPGPQKDRPPSLRRGVCPRPGFRLQPPELGGRSFLPPQPQSVAVSFSGSGHSHRPHHADPPPPGSLRVHSSRPGTCHHEEAPQMSVERASEPQWGLRPEHAGRQVCWNPGTEVVPGAGLRNPKQQDSRASPKPRRPHIPQPLVAGAGRCVPGFRLLPGDAERWAASGVASSYPSISLTAPGAPPH